MISIEKEGEVLTLNRDGKFLVNVAISSLTLGELYDLLTILGVGREIIKNVINNWVEDVYETI